jgi:phosphopantothenoylcysteine decarboxylase/phosphopantothenate--cysteine ligase
MSFLKGKNVLLGVSGSIAAYKSILLLRLLKKEDCNVKVILTKSALDFVTPLTFSTLSENQTYVNFVEENQDEKSWNNHVELAEWANYFIIAPTTSSTLSKMVTGNADNLLVATYMSYKSKVFFAPAMDLEMYKDNSNQKNIEILKDRGHYFIEPSYGFLASGMHGKGRLEDPELIIEFFKNTVKKELVFFEKKILITAGPTYEMIDPVRFIGNFSSGKMGFSLAKKASELGAKVFLISGPSNESINGFDVEIKKVVSADEMYDECINIFPNVDICIMSAAVSDYKPENLSKEKIKKDDHSNLNLNLTPNKDIISHLVKMKNKNQKIIGFALETNNELENAKSKLVRKNLDAIVMNSLNDKGAGFDFDTNQVTFITESKSTKFNLKPKDEISEEILIEILNL